MTSWLNTMPQSKFSVSGSIEDSILRILTAHASWLDGASMRAVYKRPAKMFALKTGQCRQALRLLRVKWVKLHNKPMLEAMIRCVSRGHEKND